MCRGRQTLGCSCAIGLVLEIIWSQFGSRPRGSRIHLRTVSARRIEVIEGGRAVPVRAEAPLLASSDIPWEGVLLEEFPARILETQLLGIPTVLLVFHTGGPVRQEW